MEVITGAGHLSNLDKPDEFNAAIAKFIESQEG
jgi:pimeloyl-ACP methyl ester carboxylesterase